MNKLKGKNIFPQGLALGDNFCNRFNERKYLQNNIQSIRPTLIMSPRRYGKTSLVLYVLNELKFPVLSKLDPNFANLSHLIFSLCCYCNQIIKAAYFRYNYSTAFCSRFIFHPEKLSYFLEPSAKY